MAEFIVDEWLWADLSGDNNEQKQKEAVNFLQVLWKNCDKMVAAKGSKFLQKAWSFCKKATAIDKRAKAKLFLRIRYDPGKFKEVCIEGVDVEDLDLRDVDQDDIYLIKTHRRTNALIITTDRKLFQWLNSKDIPCKLRDEFLEEYTSRH